MAKLEVNWFTKAKKEMDTIEYYVPLMDYDWFWVRRRKWERKPSFLDADEKTVNQLKKIAKKELRIQLNNWDITQEEYSEKLKEARLIIENEKRKEIIKNTDKKDPIIENTINEEAFKIISIMAIEDNDRLAENLYKIEEKLLELWIKSEIYIAKTLDWFQAKMSETQIPSTTFYVLDDMFPEDAYWYPRKNMWVKAYDSIVDRHTDFKDIQSAINRTAVVSSSEVEELREAYWERVRIIEWKSSYDISYISKIAEWIKSIIDDNPNTYNDAIDYYIKKHS